MKIFIVCRYLGGGGAERVAVNLAHGFLLRGHEVYCIADLSTHRSYQIDEKIHLLQLHKADASKPGIVMQAVPNIRRFAKKYHPDLIIGVMHFCSLASRTAVMGLNIPVVQTIHHALESETYKFSPLTVWMDRHTCPLYSKTVLLTHADKKVLSKWDDKTIVIPNPVTFDPISEPAKKEKIILSAGRLDDWNYKGWDILIQSAHEIKDYLKEKGWKMLVAGNGKEESFTVLDNMKKEYGVDDIVEFIGYQKDMLSLYRKASIFFLSSRSEGLPMVLLEAMSQGCACVATDYKGRTKEIITSEAEGLTAQPEDYVQLSALLKELVEDDSKREMIQKNAIERSKYYSLDHVVDLWETLFKSYDK